MTARDQSIGVLQEFPDATIGGKEQSK